MVSVFDGGLAIQEYVVGGRDGSPQPSALRAEFIRGEGMGGGVGGMVYSIQNGAIICSHANHRGDVIARSDDTGSLTYFALYEAYGTRPYEWGDDPDRQKANTKEEEKDLGLLNEGMRYRDLATGTFLTRDPIGYTDGPNLYCYVHCNPITRFDPLGLYVDIQTTKNEDGSMHTTFTFTAAVVFEDASLTAEQRTEAFAQIGASLVESYNGGEGNHTWSLKMNLQMVDSVDEVPETYHRIIVSRTVDPSKPKRVEAGLAHGRGAGEARIHSDTLFKTNKDGKTPAHEVLHLFGIRDNKYEGHRTNLSHWSYISENRELTTKIVKEMQNRFNSGQLNADLGPLSHSATRPTRPPTFLERFKRSWSGDKYLSRPVPMEDGRRYYTPNMTRLGGGREEDDSSDTHRLEGQAFNGGHSIEDMREELADD